MRQPRKLFCFLLSFSSLACSAGFLRAHKEEASNEAGTSPPPGEAVPAPPLTQEMVVPLAPEQVVAEGTERFAALDSNEVAGAPDALLGYAKKGDAPYIDDPVDIVARSRTFECLGRDAAGASAQRGRVTLTSCADAASTKFLFRSDRHIEVQNLPPTDVEGGVQCLAAADDGSLAVESCASSPRQLWGATGHLLQNVAEKTCLARHDGSQNGATVALVGCRNDSVVQSWAYGDYKRIQALAAVANPNFPEGRVNRASPAKHILVGFAAGEAFPALGRDVSIALRQGLDQCVAATGRRGAVNLSRCEGTRRLVFQADGHIETAERLNGGLPLCLAANASSAPAQSPLQLTDCADDDKQRWSVSGHNLQNSASKACLAYQVANYEGDQPAMQPCEATDVAQAWAFGDLQQLHTQATAAQQAYSIDQLCAVQVAIFAPSGQNAEISWLVEHFGGDSAAFARALEAKGALACKAMFDRPAEVQVLPPVAVSFSDGDYAGAASSYPYPNFIWSKAPGRWSKYSKDSTFPAVVAVHEMAHLFDRRAIVGGKDKATARKFLVEGYADWVVARAGVFAYRPSRGGSWTDGYETSSSFMLWLDENYGLKKPGDWLTDEMNVAATPPNNDPDWLASWMTSKTGSSIDALWQRYQAQLPTSRAARQAVELGVATSMGSAQGGRICGEVVRGGAVPKD